jgi:GNAT superfamily N-acetyltransferase
MTIYPATEEEVRTSYIGRRLRQFNYGFVGQYADELPIRLNARDAAGNVVGGLRSIVFLHWLRVEVLFVDESQRRTGVGTALLVEAERMAREVGAKNAALETFEFQGPAFYAKYGYVETGRIANYAGEFYLVTMAKSL